MSKCQWDNIDEFSSFNEYERFLSWINEQVNLGIAEEVPIQKRYPVFGAQECWFKCLESFEVWRLVKPDAPYKGCWIPVVRSYDIGS